MCEHHVSGFQFPSANVVNAHTIPWALRPDRTWTFSSTYAGSSHSTKPWWSTGAYTTNVASSTTSTAPCSRQSNGRAASGRVEGSFTGHRSKVRDRNGRRDMCMTSGTGH